MVAWIDGFVPTLALIALGIVLRARLLRDPTVWAGLEALTFWVLLPALLASAIASVTPSALPLGAMAAAIWGSLVLGTVLALVLSRALGHGHAAATSVVQGGIRYNNFVAFGVVGGLYGAPGVALGGVVAGLIVPVVQVLLTLVFALEGGRRVDPLVVLRQLALNPLLLGCFAGFAFAAFGGMPPGLAPLARSLGSSSIAIGLLCVGAALAPGSLRELPLTQMTVAGQKLVVQPALVLAAALAFGIEKLPATVAVAFMAMPTAPTSYVMARAMGGDARLMAAIITVQHVLALATLPLWVVALAALL